MVFLSPPNSNGLAVSTFQARTNPPLSLTRALATRSKASWDSFARKRCSQRQHLLDNVRNSRGAPPTARPSKCVISCVRRARSSAPTHTTAETPRARALNMQRRITGSLCTQTVCARNMLHLKTLGRATNLSSIKIHHVERHTGREWRIHPHVHKNALRMLTLAPPKRLPGPLCTQNVLKTYGTSERARISWTSEQPLAHQNAAYRALHRS